MRLLSLPVMLLFILPFPGFSTEPPAAIPVPLLNPGFELGPTGFTGDFELIDPGDSAGGRGAIRLRAPGGTFRSNPPIPVKPGEIFELSLWSRSAVTAGRAQFTLRFLAGNATPKEFDSRWVNVPSDAPLWSRGTARFQAPADATAVVIAGRIDGGKTGETADWDRLELVRLPPPPVKLDQSALTAAIRPPGPVPLPNPDFARASGIDVNRMRVVSVVLSTVLAAIGIIVYQQSFGFIQLYMGPFTMAFPAVAAILIGCASVNKATILNVVIGTILFQGILTMTPSVINSIVQTDMSEVVRIVVSNGMILYALTRVVKVKSR